MRFDFPHHRTHTHTLPHLRFAVLFIIGSPPPWLVRFVVLGSMSADRRSCSFSHTLTTHHAHFYRAHCALLRYTGCRSTLLVHPVAFFGCFFLPYHRSVLVDSVRFGSCRSFVFALFGSSFIRLHFYVSFRTLVPLRLLVGSLRFVFTFCFAFCGLHIQTTFTFPTPYHITFPHHHHVYFTFLRPFPLFYVPHILPHIILYVFVFVFVFVFRFVFVFVLHFCFCILFLFLRCYFSTFSLFLHFCLVHFYFWGLFYFVCLRFHFYSFYFIFRFCLFVFHILYPLYLSSSSFILSLTIYIIFIIISHISFSHILYLHFILIFSHHLYLYLSLYII